MEKVEREILSILTQDSRVSAKNIAAALQISEKEAADKIKRLEERGVIVRYSAIINADLSDEETVEALIEVKVTPQRGHGFDAIDRKSTRLNSSHCRISRMPSSA